MCSYTPSQPGCGSNPSIYQRLAQLRTEADNAVARAEEAEAKNKKLEQEILNKDQDIQSLNHRLSTAEAKLDEADGKLSDAKHVRDEHETSKTTNEGLQRKIQLLEEELDNAEKNLKETVERYVYTAGRATAPLANRFPCPSRLRQMDLKAEHFERQVHTLEQERDSWEKKYEVRQANQQMFPTHSPPIYRKSSRSIRSPRKSSTSLSRAWKGCDCATVFFLSVCAMSGLQWSSCTSNVIECSLVAFLRSTDSCNIGGSPICTPHDLFSRRINNIHLLYA